MGTMNSRTVPCRLALVGLMGAGKSRLGRLVAQHLGWPFQDIDREIERESGLTLPQIFSTEGEAGFRDRETAMLTLIGAAGSPRVVATGGGVVDRNKNLTLLKTEFYVVWIQVTPEEAARRLEGKTGRPLIEGSDPLEALRKLDQRRSPRYAQVARVTLATGPETEAERLSLQVVRALPQESSGPR